MKIQLSKVCHIENGYAFKSHDYKESGIPLVRISNFDNGEISFDDKSIYLDESFLESKSDFLVRKGDIVIALSGATTGKYGIYNFENPALLNQRIGIIRQSESKDLNDKYFYHYLKIIQDEIFRKAAGAAQPNISTREIGEIKIPLPPLETQKEIAHLLDTADALRQKTQEQLDHLDALAQSIFLEMFGDLSNPKFPVEPIGNVIELVKDGPHVSPNYSESGIPILSARNIKPNELSMNNVKYVSQIEYEKLTKKFTPQKGDILLTKGGTTGFAKNVDWSWEFCIWVHLAALRPLKDKINSIYLERVLNSKHVFKQSRMWTRGIVNRDLGLKRIIKILIPLPPIDLQNDFSNIIINIELQKKKLKQSLKESEDLFNCLLQDVFG